MSAIDYRDPVFGEYAGARVQVHVEGVVEVEGNLDYVEGRYVGADDDLDELNGPLLVPAWVGE